jgi:hypothetical protein
LGPEKAAVRLELKRHRSALPNAVEHLTDSHGFCAQGEVVQGASAGVTEQPFFCDKIIHDLTGSEVEPLFGAAGRGICIAAGRPELVSFCLVDRKQPDQ